MATPFEIYRNRKKQGESTTTRPIQYSNPTYSGQSEKKNYKWEKDMLDGVKGKSNNDKFNNVVKTMGLSDSEAKEFRKFLDYQEDSKQELKLNKNGSVSKNQSVRLGQGIKTKGDLVDNILGQKDKRVQQQIELKNIPKQPKVSSSDKKNSDRKEQYKSITGDLAIHKSNKNLETRLKAEGVDPNKDTRNFFEKAMNLPKDQNAFFDALDLLQRPLSATMNAKKGQSEVAKEAMIRLKSGEIDRKEYDEIIRKYNAGPMLDNFLDGLKGNEKVSASDVLEANGVENKVLKHGGGFAIDVLADPLNAVGGAIFKPIGMAAKGINKGADFIPGVRAGKDAVKDTFRDIFKRGGNAPEEVIKRANQADAELAYQTSKILDQNVRAVKHADSLDDGTDIQRIMENDVQINKEPVQLLQDLLDGNVSVNRADGNFGDFINEINALVGKNVLQAVPRTTGTGFDIINTDPALVKSVIGNDFKTAVDLVNPSGAFDEVNIPRPDRTPSSEPMLNHIATKMMETNDEIRALAQTHSIPLNELEGYMAHVLSEAELTARGKAPASGVLPMGGNSNVAKQRTLDGSVEDVNELLGKELFDPNAFFATAQGQKRLSEYIIKESFKRDVLQNFGTKIDATFDRSAIPKGMTIIKPEQFNFYKSVNPNGTSNVGVSAGDEFLVHKGTKQLLENYSYKTSDEGLSKFARGFDKVNEMWKKFALFSTGYHARNILGNSWNMHVADMNPAVQAKYTIEGMNDIRLYKAAKDKEFMNLPLSPKEQAALKEYDEFLQQGLKGSTFYEADFAYNADKAFGNAIKNADKSLGRKAVETTVNPTKWFEFSREVGESADTIQRYAFYKWSRKQGLNTEQSTNKVKEVLFDYRDLSETERKVFKRVAPFYTFTRKNIPFQLKNMYEKPMKYSNLDKAVDASYDAQDIDQEILPEWLQNSMAIGTDGDGEGNGKAFNANLPAADLARWSENPVREAFGMVNPIGKEVVQQMVDRDFFYDAPLDKITQGDMFGIPMNSNVEHALEQLGAVRNADRNLKDIQDGNLFDPLTGNMFKDINVEKELNAREWEKKEKLDKLLASFKKKHGRNPRTLEELGY